MDEQVRSIAGLEARDTIGRIADKALAIVPRQWPVRRCHDMFSNGIERLTDRRVAVLAGGTRAWEAAGLPIERGLLRAVEEVDDVYKRPYEGTDNAAAAMQGYLDWEFGLVEQLARDGTHGFQVL